MATIWRMTANLWTKLLHLSLSLTSRATVVSTCELLRPMSDAVTVSASDEIEEEEGTAAKKTVRPVVAVETSLRYMKSKAYENTYGTDPVWKNYRRNFKGCKPPLNTRKKCIRAGIVATGNPCPICRDEYLVLDHLNVELLKQFLSPITGKIVEANVTGLCQMRQLELRIAVTRAKDYGLLTFQVPRRVYDYSEYFFDENKNKNSMNAVPFVQMS